MSDLFNENTEYLTRNMIAEIFQRLSGKTGDGQSKVVLSYQSYAEEEPDDSVNKTQIYTTEKASVEFSTSFAYLNFITVDIVFHSYNDPELKLLWGRLQRFKRNRSTQADQNWVFYINILERASVSFLTEERDKLLTANIVNPELFFLTREVPDQLVTESLDETGTLQGGNVIRMLVPAELITFEEMDDVDTNEIKGEVMRQIMDENYLNNSDTDTGESW